MQGCSAYEAMKHLAGKRETIVAPSSFHREAHIEHRIDEPRANNRRHIQMCIRDRYNTTFPCDLYFMDLDGTWLDEKTSPGDEEMCIRDRIPT